MLDQKICSVRKAFYLRAGYLDVIFSVDFAHKRSEKYRFCGCLRQSSSRSNSIFVSRQTRFGKFSVFGPITIEFSYVNYKGKYSNLHCIFAVIYKGKVNSNCRNTLIFQKRVHRETKMRFDLLDLHFKHPQNLYFPESLWAKPTEKITSRYPARR